MFLFSKFSSQKKLHVSLLLALNSSKLGHIAITDIRDALSMSNSEELNDEEEEKVDDFVDVRLDVKYSNFRVMRTR
jgi:hypothetical protein